MRDPEVLERIRGLVIPPAWQRVWICPEPNGHIQAVGRDDADRLQYLYHPQWRRARDEEKHERVLTLAGRLPVVRAEIAEDLARRATDRRRVLAYERGTTIRAEWRRCRAADITARAAVERAVLRMLRASS